MVELIVILFFYYYEENVGLKIMRLVWFTGSPQNMFAVTTV